MTRILMLVCATTAFLWVGCDDGSDGGRGLELGQDGAVDGQISVDAADAPSPDGAPADAALRDAARLADAAALPDAGGDVVAPAAPQPYSGGDCPAFAAGRNTFAAGTKMRTFDLFLPAEPEGAPLLYMWHPLGSNAGQIASFLGAANAARTHGFIVAVPESLRTQTEWGYFGSPVDDLALFDDLYACLTTQFATDTTRTYTIGFSAGALWSSYLVVHRAEYLTAAVILSGGISPTFLRYSTPAYRIPVLLAWGGPTDQYGGVINFQETTYAFRDALRGDEHAVVMCGHNGGHVPPQGVASWGYAFLDMHRVRDGRSPITASAMAAELSGICSLAE